MRLDHVERMSTYNFRCCRNVHAWSQFQGNDFKMARVYLSTDNYYDIYPGRDQEPLPKCCPFCKADFPMLDRLEVVELMAQELGL